MQKLPKLGHVWRFRVPPDQTHDVVLERLVNQHIQYQFLREDIKDAIQFMKRTTMSTKTTSTNMSLSTIDQTIFLTCKHEIMNHGTSPYDWKHLLVISSSNVNSTSIAEEKRDIAGCIIHTLRHEFLAGHKRLNRKYLCS